MVVVFLLMPEKEPGHKTRGQEKGQHSGAQVQNKRLGEGATLRRPGTKQGARRGATFRRPGTKQEARRRGNTPYL